jgi:Tfp pilus assembly pilus retraction ATPase PilT|tara:strand:+ start:1630 stop:2679 length:1050 start_codon:yes stop_codon:yes gene_type:complete
MTMIIPPELERLMREAVEREASDLFLIPGEPPTFRVNGQIERLERDPFTAEEITGVAVAVFGNDSLSRVGKETGVIRRSCHLDDQIYGRISLARAYGDYTISVARVGMVFMSVEELRLPAPMVDAVLAPYGLVVLCGGIGSGVYTCAYSLLDHHNAQCADHICTVEPIVLGRMTPKKAIVQQREIGIDVPDCLTGISAAMNQDPDVLYVSEIGSVEELQACITAAVTGHLVVTVLNLRISPEAAVERLLDIFPEEIRDASRKDLAKVLRCVSSQRLLPKIGGGREAAFGVLVPDDEMRGAIAEGRDVMDRKRGMPDGYRSISDDITRLRDEGVISKETATRTLGELHVL